MIDNTGLLRELSDVGRLRIAASPDLPKPEGSRPPMDRVRGTLLGLAIGDSLGNTTESQTPANRIAAHGEIRDYLPNRYANGKAVGLPSDDTQLAAWLLDSMLDRGGFDPEDVAKRYGSQQIFGIGKTMRDFLAAAKSGLPVWECGQHSAGNGAIMRVAVVPLFHAGAPSGALWADALLSSALTHNDPTSTASCLAFAAIIWDLLHMPSPPEPEWWPRRFVEVARPIEGPTRLTSRVPGTTFEGSLCDFIEAEVLAAWQRGVPLADGLNRWYSGAYLLETVPSALYLLMTHANDTEEVIVRSVNDTWDNDTVAAIVGAAVGALHGEEALPQRWRDRLLGRTTGDDDGHLCQTLERLETHLRGCLS